MLNFDELTRSLKPSHASKRTISIMIQDWCINDYGSNLGGFLSRKQKPDTRDAVITLTAKSEMTANHWFPSSSFLFRKHLSLLDIPSLPPLKPLFLHEPTFTFYPCSKGKRELILFKRIAASASALPTLSHACDPPPAVHQTPNVQSLIVFCG